MNLTMFAASGVEWRPKSLTRARKRLSAMGFAVTSDASLKMRSTRFAGSDDDRLATLMRVAQAAPDVALACRGGYGLTRLLDRIDWRKLGRSVEQGTRWVGYSDLTALQLGMLAHGGYRSWHGPMACDDFGRELGADDDADDANAVTCDAFAEAMSGELEAVGFRTEPGMDGLTARGTLWGGNLTMVCSLLGTPHWPNIDRGILFLEDVAEHPYRVERMLLQLLQAGVLTRQKAVLLGQFSQWKPSPLDRGYSLKTVVAHLRNALKVPIITGLPVGHEALKLSLPQGMPAALAVEGRECFIGWG